MATRQSVCAPWATLDDVCPPCDGDTIPPEDMLTALAMASDVLFNFTRRRWPGTCRETVYPTGVNAVAVPRAAICVSSSRLRLPGYPVVEVHTVTVDGAALAADAYHVEDARTLVRDDGKAWPRAGSTGWTVDYSFGVGPPVGGVRAAASLACQLALACAPESVSGRCRLPKRVTTITRQGMTLAVLDPLTLFDKGLTGLSEVDLWVASVNRGDRTRRATVLDPGQRVPNARRR